MAYDSKYTGAEVEIILDSVGGKVDKQKGKQLSTEDFTTLLKQKLEGLSNYDDSEIVAAFNQLRTEFNALVGGNASAAINSFNEIIAFLEGIEDSQKLDSIIASIEQQIAAKGTYTKPNGGIPKSDLASAVQTSLGKADTALQSYTEQYKGTVTGIKMNGVTKNPASGIVDLGNVITDVSDKADKSVVGAYYKAAWTASEAVGISVRLTDILTLPAGTYIVSMGCPYCSDLTMEICIGFSAKMAIGSGNTFIKACYGTVTMLAQFTTTTNLSVLTAASNTNAKWSYLDRGGIAAIRIA